jgi:hypothetical protein
MNLNSPVASCFAFLFWRIFYFFSIRVIAAVMLAKNIVHEKDKTKLML